MAFTMFPEFSFQITETTNERNLRLLMGLGFGVLMREARFATWIYEHFSYWVLVRVGWHWCTETPPLTGPTISSALHSVYIGQYDSPVSKNFWCFFWNLDSVLL